MYFYNTLTRQKEEFKPVEEGRVGMYHCGPTVYNYAHIGNTRPYVFSDIIRRLFEHEGYEIKQVINITDVGHLVSDADEGDDKMNIAMRREGKTADEIALLYTDAFFSDLKKLNVRTEYTEFPRATLHITEQIAMIEKLEKKGFTYTTSDGVYFDTSKLSDYGKLAQLDVEGLKEGARVEKNPEKKNITDFALWKFSEENAENIRLQEWPSPWGVGFPGWHIECSAMSMKYLGEHFDIHTGGVDHIPVHHTNEIAQSEGATGKPFVNIWMHSNHILVDGQKMSKSLGNIYTITDISKKGIDPLAYRYWLLTAHYRTLVNFTWDAVEGAQSAFKKLQAFVTELPAGGNVDIAYKAEFESFIEDDLDTPKAIALLWELVKDAEVLPQDKKATILYFDEVLGLNLKNLRHEEIPKDIIELAKKRETAREEKNWHLSDEIRRNIEARGYELKDTEDGPKIVRK